MGLVWRPKEVGLVLLLLRDVCGKTPRCIPDGTRSKPYAAQRQLWGSPKTKTVVACVVA